jgi:hypothetical protein
MEETLGSSLLHANIVKQPSVFPRQITIFQSLWFTIAGIKRKNFHTTLESTWTCLHRKECKRALNKSFKVVLQLQGQGGTFSPLGISHYIHG